MEANFQIFLILLAVLAAGALLARRLDVAPAILLLATGVALAFVPGLPRVELPPDLILLIVLPPLIYSAGVAMSWREFRFNLRPIALLAIGCVFFTAATVATVTHYVIGLPWGIGFLLGAIVAPPDVVAPLAIARKLRLPRRILVILEGEGLVNDATALILYRFATVAIVTGAFSLPKATATFGAVIVGEILFGILVGWLSLHARQWARDPKVEITLSLLTPYLAFWIPEHYGGSGVLATVACGLYISWNGPLLISAATRLQGVFFWDLVIYLIEGLLFLLTGFQMRLLIEKSKDSALTDAFLTTVLVVILVVVARFVWVYLATYLPRLVDSRLRTRDPLPSWRHIFILAFTGVRGAVSLAAALALPLTLADGAAFPYRDLILFVSFGVILMTMIGIGLSLPLVVRWLGIADHGDHEMRQEREIEIAARRDIIEASRRSLKTIVAARGLPASLAAFLEARHETRMRGLPDPPAQPGELTPATKGAPMVREMIGIERVLLHRLLRDGKISDETRRRIERDLDLEEAIALNRDRV